MSFPCPQWVPEVILVKPEEPKNTIPSLESAKRRYRWKRLLAKKWFFPAVYMVVAALILTIAWWVQQRPFQQVTSPTKNITKDEVLPVEETEQGMIQPIKQNAGTQQTMGFYDEAGSKESKETSLVNYANTYWPHTGIDFARKDGKTFDVVATLPGKILRVEENPIVGMQVAIAHESGVVTVYQSLADVKVKKGQQVAKGDVIAQAGRNNFEKEAGIHLHYEVHQDQKPVNPANYIQ